MPHILSSLLPDSSMSGQNSQHRFLFHFFPPISQACLEEVEYNEASHGMSNVHQLTMESTLSSSFGEAKDKYFLDAM